MASGAWQFVVFAQQTVCYLNRPTLILFAVVFGLFTEMLQHLQPGRVVEVADVAANTAGAAVACVVVLSAHWVVDSRSGGR